MKPIALKQLQEAIQTLSFTLANAGKDNTEDTKEDIRKALEFINAAIFTETPNTSRKFDLYKIVADDPVRPVMCGVLHQDGYKVASDTHVLVAVKEQYGEDLEGHVIDKTGHDIVGKYPKWQELFPKKEEGEGVYRVDTAAVFDFMKTVKVEEKAVGKHGIARRGYVKVGETFFRIDVFFKLCTFMDAYGATEIHTMGARRAAYVYAPDGSKALIMPSLYAVYHDEGGRYHDGKTCADVLETAPTRALWLELA